LVFGWKAQAKDNDLVLRTVPTTRPANAFFWISQDLEVRCFTVTGLSETAQWAATDTELWIGEPFGFYLWDEIAALWEEPRPKEKPKPAGGKP